MTEVTANGDLKLTVPAYDKELERMVLGVFLLEKDAFALYGERLNSDCFYDLDNEKVFKAILSLFKEGSGIDSLTVLDRCRSLKFDAVTPYFLTGLQMCVGSDAHIEDWIDILISKNRVRQLSKLSVWAYYSLQKPDLNDLDFYSEYQERLQDIYNQNNADQEITFKEEVKSAVSDIKKMADGKKSEVGIQSGFDFIDRNMMGLVAPDLTIIAARPGMGKTTLAWNLVLNLARRGIHVGFFSFEMKSRQLVWKTISNFLPDTINNIRSGHLQKSGWDSLGEKYDTIQNLPIHINDKGSMNVDQIKATGRMWQLKYDVKVILIDYLQLIPAIPELRKSNRESQVSYNSRYIKSIAMEYDLPVVLLSQLSRQGENVEPELHHLRESGAIEQDADNVIFIHKNDEETERNYPGWYNGSPEWITDLLLKKCRLGGTGRRSMIFNAANNVFKEMNDQFYEPLNYSDYSEPKDNPF